MAKYFNRKKRIDAKLFFRVLQYRKPLTFKYWARVSWEGNNLLNEIGPSNLYAFILSRYFSSVDFN